ncbi:hypothetical protein KP78_03050 [Jeotgalibacillus soli]|uniref:STAS domain-containing protein n=2 Tax=Jeotgalibacillus soli TaxID=889306 RepID=A0A0C2RNT6_9BACL|nr:hypothetical protein KP78_03050 [Jeotgalibacillus soli]
MNEKIDKEFIDSIISPDELKELNQWRAQFISLVGEAIKENSKDAVWTRVTEWAKLTGESAVQREVSLDEALTTLTSYRTVTWRAILEQLKDVHVANEDLIQMGFVIDPVIDHAGYVFSTSYVDNHRRTIDRAQQAVLEYSVPVVGLSEKVAILPLVGDLDTHRAKVLKESSLFRCRDLRNSVLILDLSGVPIVDTVVANEIFQVIKALRLIGVDTVLTGLRPEIAQSVVEMGISFNGITIKKNLQNAIEYLQSTGNF